jgi:hypothetical protein
LAVTVVLGAVAAIDLGRIGAGAAFHHVAVVSGFQIMRSSPPPEHLVVAVPAGQHVAPSPPKS